MTSTNSVTTTVYDVLDPIADKRSSVRWQGDRLLEIADKLSTDGGREVDGAHLWMLPPIYDADAHMPHVPFGVRQSDLYRAIAGGVCHMNVALPFEDAKEMELSQLVADLGRSQLPAIKPILSVSPVDESSEFPAWLSQHGQEITEFMPPIVKLYSMDDNFERNLDAVLRASLMPMIWHETLEALEKVVSTVDVPIYLRHATSAAMAEVMRSAKQATVQTCPHFLLPLGDERRDALIVLPPPPPDDDRRSLCSVFLDQVDAISSDHNAPGIDKSIGPGLQTQQHFLPALLTICDQNGWPLERVLQKVTTTPASIFGTDLKDGFVLVDPKFDEPVECWPRQSAGRAPFLGMTFKYRIVAIAYGGLVQLV